VQGEGMPLYEDADRFGDLFVTFTVQFPNSVTQEQKEGKSGTLMESPFPIHLTTPMHGTQASESYSRRKRQMQARRQRKRNCRGQETNRKYFLAPQHNDFELSPQWFQRNKLFDFRDRENFGWVKISFTKLPKGIKKIDFFL